MNRIFQIRENFGLSRARTISLVMAVIGAAFFVYLFYPDITIENLLFAAFISALIYFDVLRKQKESMEEERKYKLELLPEGIKYIWDGNHSLLAYSEVTSVDVYGNLGEPKAILFKMKNGAKHEITKYEDMKEILLHAQSKLPLSLFTLK